jgi:gamma-tubulin complex component 3
LFIFQGIDGKYISYSILDDSYSISASVTVGEPARGMILELCEIGWLFKKITDYVHKRTDNVLVIINLSVIEL